jgi:hypothetical protein
VQTLLDYLEEGESIDDFLEGYPAITREHVIALLGGGEGPSDRSGVVWVSLDECVDWRFGA